MKMSLGGKIRTAVLSFDTLLLIVVGVLCAYAIGTIHAVRSDVAKLEKQFEDTAREVVQKHASTSDIIAALEAREVLLSDDLYAAQKDLDELADNVEGFDRTVGKLSGSVETLEKLTTTDPELLQKYSRVYFLNEHYIPSDLVIVDEQYDLENGKEVSVHAEVWPFLEELLEEAWEDDVELMILSGYRSFKEQNSLKSHYKTVYGTGANTFSADQGYSEHQLGTTVDFTTKEGGENLDVFGNTDAYRWLLRHAYKYGFVMSYPENNEYYVFEPWHWRFVGEDLSRYLHKRDKHFYDLEQRKIDDYIPTLFD